MTWPTTTSADVAAAPFFVNFVESLSTTVKDFPSRFVMLTELPLTAVTFPAT
jgi:hypothetical protein